MFSARLRLISTIAWGSLVVLLMNRPVEGEVWTERIAFGLSQPLYLTSPPGDTQRLFVVEKRGTIRIVDPATGSIDPTPFLDVRNIVSTDSERGLLGLAFHPDFEHNGLFYVNLTNGSGTTEVRSYHVSDDPGVADMTTMRPLLSISQPQSNHNGGWIGFGPDNYLYVATGDGGGANDPGNVGQNLNSLLGKMLRIDVDTDDFPQSASLNYGIPVDNPFAGDGNAATRDEIWAYGLRNPWRNSFDRLTGDLYIGDVGQGVREEINFQPAGAAGGANYGWRLREGSVATPGVGGPEPGNYIGPLYDYLHGSGAFAGNSVTGGYVYRGPIKELQGKYFFGDFVSSRIWSLEVDPDAGTLMTDSVTDWTVALRPRQGTIDSISSFGEDASGNLYILDFGGEVFAIVPEPSGMAGWLLTAMILARARRRRCLEFQSA